MPARRILALIDFSARGEALLRHAAGVATKERASLIAVHAIDSDPLFGSDGPGGRLLPAERQFFMARAAGEKLNLFLARNDASWAESAVLSGSVEAALGRLIARWQPDLILADEKALRQQPILRRFGTAESPALAAEPRPRFTRAALLGGATALLYWLLFANEALVLQLSVKGRWYFVIPVAVAFLFSFVHGAFTAEFWNAVGIRPRRRS